MKKQALLAISIVCALGCFSQPGGLKQVLIESKFVVVAQPGIDIAIGEFSKTHSVGVSAALSGLAKLSDNIRAGLRIEENLFFGKKVPGTDVRHPNENIIRIVPEILVYPKSVNIMLKVDAGISIITGPGFSETGFTGGIGIGVPILGKIPILQTLFRSKRLTATKTELMVFLTPKALNDPGE